MFKKLLSNLPYNPSLIGQVAFYAKRMHSEASIRRLGLGFMVLAMFIQMFTVFNPPEPTLAMSRNDIVPGGFSTHTQANTHCRSNNYQFRTVLEHFGVSCADLANASTKNIRSTDYNKKLVSLGRLPYGKTGERAVKINGKTYYQRYLWSWDSGPYSTYKALVGTTKSGTPFMVLYNCGNITVIETKPQPKPEPKPAPTPQAEPEPTPIAGNATCDRLTATRREYLKYRFKAFTSGSSYAVKSYEFDFGDGSPTKTFNTGLYNKVADHTYSQPGSYTASAAIKVDIQNGDQKITKTLSCQTNITIAAVTTPVAEPEPVDECPDIPGNQSSNTDCKPCEEAANDNDATACLVLSKKAENQTQGIENADGTVAHANDVITYELSVTNTGRTTVSNFTVEENVSDILDYATITDLHGAKLDDDNIARWNPINIGTNETITKKLTVKIKDPIPQTPIATSNPGTFDMTLTNVYGDEVVEIMLPPSITKTTEQVVRQLPNTGPGESLAAVVGITIFVSYFYARSRLIAKELDIVRLDYANSGGH